MTSIQTYTLPSVTYHWTFVFQDQQLSAIFKTKLFHYLEDDMIKIALLLLK